MTGAEQARWLRRAVTVAVVVAEGLAVAATGLAHPVLSPLMLVVVPTIVWLGTRWHPEPPVVVEDAPSEEQSWALGAVADAARRDAGLDVADGIERCRELGCDEALINVALSRGRAARCP